MRVHATTCAMLALWLVAGAPVWSADILIYGPSLGGGLNEETIATDQGHNVTVADEATWSAMTTGQFAAFDALVIGDRACDLDPGYLAAAIANRTTWSPAVTGNITLQTFDVFFHGVPEGYVLVANGINFAASGAGTGLYFTTGCADDATAIDQFGTFTLNPADGANTIRIINAAHAIVAGLTNGGLSNWFDSAHSGFITFPRGFERVALSVDPPGARAVILAHPLGSRPSWPQ